VSADDGVDQAAPAIANGPLLSRAAALDHELDEAIACSLLANIFRAQSSRSL
jgi:hypothetical protein